MAVGMVAYLMAFCRHPQQQFLVAGDLLSDHKESGAGAPIPQAVQENGGSISPGAVVKSQRHIFEIPCGNCSIAACGQGLLGSEQQDWQQQQRQQNTEFFHVITRG